MVVVDVGANIGIYTLYAARLLAGKGKVHSFEPTPRTWQILRDNVQVNGFLELGLIELHECAVSDRAGTAGFFIFRSDSGHNTLFEEGQSGERIEVSTVALDEALRDEARVDIVKIDAEGAEPFILRGMRGVIERSPGIRILMEFAPAHLRRAGIDPAGFLDEIAALGFTFRRIHDETGEPLVVSRDQLVDVLSANLELARAVTLSGDHA
jgi:FkbM family methyltransferase